MSIQCEHLYIYMYNAFIFCSTYQVDGNLLNLTIDGALVQSNAVYGARVQCPPQTPELTPRCQIIVFSNAPWSHLHPLVNLGYSAFNITMLF